MYEPFAPSTVWSAFLIRCARHCLLLCLVLGLAPALSMAASSKARPKNPSKQPVQEVESWAFGKNPMPVEQVWTQGVAPRALKEAAVTGLKNKALKNSVKAPSVPPVAPPEKGLHKTPQSFPPQPGPRATTQKEAAKALGMPLGKNMRLRGEMENMTSSWHNTTVKKAMRVDQDLTREETNVIGAYADIAAGEDLTFSAGPELSHTKSQSSGQSATHSTATGLGLGFHLKWDF